MTESTHIVCSTSNCDNKATHDSGGALVCGSCLHGMITMPEPRLMDETARADARRLVSSWFANEMPTGWVLDRPGRVAVEGRDRELVVEIHPGRALVRIGREMTRIAAVEAAIASVAAGTAPGLVWALQAALDDGDSLRGVIARAIEASNNIADRDAEDAIQEMLSILLEHEPEGYDDRIEWSRLEGANAMLEVIQREGYGARGIAMNRDALRKAAAELAVATTMPRNPEPEFEAALLQREVEQLRAQLAEQREAAHARADRQADEWRAEVDKMRKERDQARALAAEFRTRTKVEAQDVRREGATWEKYVAWVHAGTTGMHKELLWSIAEDVPATENVDQYIADDIRWMVEDADAGCSGWDLLAEIAAMVIE
jgi:hypothetical protein